MGWITQHVKVAPNNIICKKDVIALRGYLEGRVSTFVSSNSIVNHLHHYLLIEETLPPIRVGLIISDKAVAENQHATGNNTKWSIHLGNIIFKNDPLDSYHACTVSPIPSY